ncbi:MAG: hypothetical protein HKM94_07720, partial [Halobacteria archaeon]|nr:hypothetical protein [Halobacteria archaeon]
TATNRQNQHHTYYVNHPCHPLNGYRFELIRSFNSLGTIRVEFFGPDGKRTSLPARCTTFAEEDLYIQFVNSGDLFRLPDLVALADLMDLIRSRKD